MEDVKCDVSADTKTFVFRIYKCELKQFFVLSEFA
jgi:hypothetical protein